MLPNPNDTPAGFFYQTGATAYLIDPAGAYSLAGASAATTGPAGTDSSAGASAAPTLAAAGAYIPITGATYAAAEIVDPAGAYIRAGASAPTPADLGTHFPAAGASALAEIVDPPAHTVGRARARRGPIRPAGAAPPARARRCSRPRALTFQ